MELACHSPQGMKHQSLMSSGMRTPLRCLPNQESWKIPLQLLLDRKTSETPAPAPWALAKAGLGAPVRESPALGETQCLRPAAASAGDHFEGGSGKACLCAAGASRHFSVTAMGLGSLGQGRQGGGRAMVQNNNEGFLITRQLWCQLNSSGSRTRWENFVRNCLPGK